MSNMNAAPAAEWRDPKAPVKLRAATHAALLDRFIDLNIQGIRNGALFKVVGGMGMRIVSLDAKLTDRFAASAAATHFIFEVYELAQALPGSKVGDGIQKDLDRKWASVNPLLTENWLAYDALQMLYASSAFNPHKSVVRASNNVFDERTLDDSAPTEAESQIGKYYGDTFRGVQSQSEIVARSVLTAVAEHRLATGGSLREYELEGVFGWAGAGKLLDPPSLGHVVSALVHGGLAIETPKVTPARIPQVLEPIAAMAITGAAELQPVSA